MLEKLTVRGFEQGDENAMVRIHKDSVEKFENLDVDENFIMRLSKRPDFRFFVADDDGEIVGFLGAVFYSSVGRAEVGPISIAEGYRNSGVGSRLLDDCENFLRTLNIRRVTAKVKYDNNESINFFKKHGFEQEAVFRRYTKDYRDVVQFVKFL